MKKALISHTKNEVLIFCAIQKFFKNMLKFLPKVDLRFVQKCVPNRNKFLHEFGQNVDPEVKKFGPKYFKKVHPNRHKISPYFVQIGCQIGTKMHAPQAPAHEP